MLLLLFVVMVALLGVIILATAIVAHQRIGRRTAGWWAGLTVAILLLGASHAEFSSLPGETVNTGCETEHRTDWDAVAAENVQVQWGVVAAALFAAVVGLEILRRLQLGERAIAVLLLVAVMTSAYSVVYVFAIRRLGSLVFSTVMGGLFGTLLDWAFGNGSDLRSKDNGR